MAAAQLKTEPEGPEMLQATPAAEEPLGQERRERDLVAGLDLAPYMVLDRAAGLDLVQAMALDQVAEELREEAPLELLVEERFLAAHCPPMLEQPVAWREAEPGPEAVAVLEFRAWWQAWLAVAALAEQEAEAAEDWSRPKKKFTKSSAR